MTRIKILLAVFTAAMCIQAQAFTISDIRVEGLQRVSAGTVFAAIPVNVGDDLTEA
ncbi:MAG: outer membrane protein insertion porin family, partial [Litorivivens sp.]